MASPCGRYVITPGDTGWGRAGRSLRGALADGVSCRYASIRLFVLVRCVPPAAAATTTVRTNGGVQRACAAVASASDPPTHSASLSVSQPTPTEALSQPGGAGALSALPFVTGTSNANT